jgi:[ribosomal protein S18]-alanine N-acetyltransferase
MDFDLRTATTDDLPAIMELETSTFATDAWSADSMSSELASVHTYYLIATVAGDPQKIAGYGGLLAPEGSGEADIQTLAVAPFARRNGLGRTLVEDLVAQALARDAEFVFLEVRADNPAARALYDSLGFEQVGVRARYYQPDNVDAQVMRLLLSHSGESL